MANPQVPTLYSDKPLTPSQKFAIGLIDDVALISAMLIWGVVASPFKGAGKAIGKIIGHMPGWAARMTTESVGGAFKPGRSWHPDGNEARNIFSKISGRGIASAVLAGSLVFGSPAFAHNAIPVKNEAKIQVKASSLKSVADAVSSQFYKTTKEIQNASNALYYTAIHESQRLMFRRQMTGKGKTYKANGVARSVYMVEPSTAKDIIARSKKKPKARSLLEKESGLSYKHLSKLTKKQVADEVMKHDHLAAAIALIKYDWVKGDIPSSLKDIAKYWSKGYQTTNNSKKERSFVKDNELMKSELEAAAKAKVSKKQLKKPLPKKHPVVNKLHKSKTMHAVASKSKKLNVMGKIMRGIK